MNIAVLCGGLSAERDVSITGAVMISKALQRRGHKTVLLDLFFGYGMPFNSSAEIFSADSDNVTGAIGETAPDLDALRHQRGGVSRIGADVIDVCRMADIVFLSLHGEDGEDGKIQAVLDLHGIRYTGTGMTGSAIAMNKSVSKQLLSQNGINTPRGRTVSRGDVHLANRLFEDFYKNYGLPLAVKPCSGGSSVGASIVRSKAEFAPALSLALKYDTEAVVEQYISGRECNVGVLAGKALPVIEIRTEYGFFDYKNKYQKGMAQEICPADLPLDTTLALQRTAEQVFETLKFDVYGRMDFIVREDGEIWCLEGNTLPGMTSSSLLPQEAAAAGIPYDDLCELIVMKSLKKYESGIL